MATKTYRQPKPNNQDTGSNGYKKSEWEMPKDVCMTVGSISNGQIQGPKTSGIKIRGTGAATKGTMARGPMA